MNAPVTTAYGWLMLLGIGISIALWTRVARRDHRLLLIYIAALLGAFLGAKLVYLVAEGWLHWHDENRWLHFATGKSILGALLGGYSSVEIAKRLLGYTKATGDWFALIAPAGIIIGRIGCLLHGCCLGVECDPFWFTIVDRDGVARWPAVPVEIAFNLVALVGFGLLRWRRVLPGQHFHLYLIGYGAFRFAHEWVRATPDVLGRLSGYQVASLLLVALGVIGFIRRMQSCGGANSTVDRERASH